jgi:Spy/CpxP family protein refolding chaperone
MACFDLVLSRHLCLVAETAFSRDRTRKERMKGNAIVALLLCIVTSSQPAFTGVQRKPTGDEPPHATIARSSADCAHVSADLSATTPVIPRGPRDVLRDYELQMASMGAQLSMDLGAISNAVRTGQISKEQGEYVIGERYQVAMMQFQLFGVLHSMREADIAWTRAVPAEPTPPAGGEVALVAMPFSSLQLSPTLVEYLGLTRTQAKAIQKLMDQERPTTKPLMDELRTVGAELGVAIRQNRGNDNEGVAQSLAATQARLLKQLMRANSRLQRRIDNVLGRQQRKKLDALRHKAEVSVVLGS